MGAVVGEGAAVPVWRDWKSRAVAYGAIALLLQQVAVAYRLPSPEGGAPVQASLAHLHAGWLLAIAMLDRDLRVLLGCSCALLAGWMVRATLMDYSGGELALGVVNAALTLGWTWLCARWLGWPRRDSGAHVTRRELPRIYVIGLLVYPVGLTLGWALLRSTEAWSTQVYDDVQVLFAKHFGVSIVTFPLVVGWTERRRGGRRLSLKSVRWSLVLMAFLFASMWGSVWVRSWLPGGETERGFVLMDYRFAVFALLAWAMVHLRPTVAMSVLSLAMFGLVRSLDDTAPVGVTSAGFLNLAHLAIELSILLVSMLYFHLSDRDARDLSRRLVEESRRDAVTRLPNLNALVHRLGERGVDAREIGCLLLDKVDALAQGVGLATRTRLMNAVAGGLADLVEVYYLGTGEFALLPHDGGSDDIWGRVLRRIEHLEPESDRQPIRLLPYVGVAECASTDRAGIDSAMMRASFLAHEARRRNEMQPLYTDADGDVARAAMRLQEAAEALSCLRGDRVVLLFQPIAPVQPVAHPEAGGDAVCGEVLCRLRRSDGTLLTPDRFLRAIEGAGRGAELDLAVLRALFAWLRAHPRAAQRAARIAINLTGQSLASAAFRDQLLDMLDDPPVPAPSLCFEIIETAAIVSPTETIGFLAALRAQGCSVAIDDFGVGMQSFERLRELPVDLIKIDGSFVRNVALRGKDHALVQASVAVARAFGARTVAEYVEDDATVECLRELGVDWMQGYLIARPMPIAQAFGLELAEAG